MIMDAPCHGKKYHSESDDYPNGSPEGLVLEDLIKEFCKKEIEFTVIKLDNNCDKMINVMKECHQELEVQDMTTMKPSYSSYSSRAMPVYEESASYGGYARESASYGGYAEESGRFGCEMACMDTNECVEELNLEPTKSKGIFSSMFGGSKKSKAKAAPEMMKKSRAAPMMSAAPMISMKNDMAMSKGSMKMMSAAPVDFEME